MQKITPFLWFDHQAEEAAKFYTSIFKNSKIVSTTQYSDVGPGPRGSVMSVVFQLHGQDFYALNGGPQFTFSPAISLFVSCENQQEIDEYWERLSQAGQIQQCGWLTDKFGVTWQIVPKILGEMMNDKDPERSKRVMQAMMQMVKLDIQGLKDAYEQVPAR